MHISGQVKSPPMSPPSEGMVMRIETTRAPVPSQPEVVLSDGKLTKHLSFTPPIYTKPDKVCF
jgi:hypothetical protein